MTDRYMTNFFVLIFLTIVSFSLFGQESTLAVRLNGHKYTLVEDYFARVVQESYDNAIDTTDFTELIDTLKAQLNVDITDLLFPEDINVIYLVDSTDTSDFIIGVSLDSLIVIAETEDCNFTILSSNIGLTVGGHRSMVNGEYQYEITKVTTFTPEVAIDADGPWVCNLLVTPMKTAIKALINQSLAELESEADTLDLNEFFAISNLMTSFGIEDSTLLEEAVDSFPIDLALYTEPADEDTAITQLVVEINFLTGTTTDPYQFIGIEPDEVINPHLKSGGFSFLYHQLQKGFNWHTDWSETQRVDAAFNLMDSLDIKSYRLETFWSKVQTKTYTGENLNPDDIIPAQIDSFLAEAEYWDTTAFSDVQLILDHGYSTGLTPFMAIGVGHQDRMPRTAAGLRIIPATPDYILPEGYVGVSADVYLYNLKIYAHAAVRRFADDVDVWQAENELNAAGFAASPDWWRKGDLWKDSEFRNRVMAILIEAVRTEDPTALVTHDFHMLGFMQAIESWGEELDIIGVNFYPNQTSALPIMGFTVGEYIWAVRRVLKGLGCPDKPVWLVETGYPAIIVEDPSDTLLYSDDALYFSENRQKEYVETALSSAVENGAEGFFYFSLTAEEDSTLGGGTELATFMRFSGLVRRDTDEPKVALGYYAELYNQLVLSIIDTKEETIVPQYFTLYQNYPNPFNPVTTIRFDLPETGNVQLIIYDVLGREVTRLVSSRLVSGDYSVNWDASNVSSGIYFYRVLIRQDGILSYNGTKKLVVLK